MGQESNREEESDIIKELRHSLKSSESMIDNQRETLLAQRRILDANESNLAGMRSEMESTVANMMLDMEKQRSKYYQDVEVSR
jgi:septal ring factor EnvC (AmiA/AmiB activator)